MHTLLQKPRYRFRMVIPSYPAFNIYSAIACKTTALGPLHIATNVNRLQNWVAEVIDENNFCESTYKTEKEIDHQKIQGARQADVVGLYGGLTSTIPRLYELAGQYKRMGAVTIAGGQHFCDENIAEALEKGVDYIITGEGEDAVGELIDALQGNRSLSHIQGLAYLHNGELVRTQPRTPICDFESYPQPDFSLVRSANLSIYPVERIRGCGMDCEFCTVKGLPRPSSVERTLEQISYLAETRNARHFFVVDDLFGQQRQETLRFCRMLSEYRNEIGKRLSFTVQIRLDKAEDAELLSAMRNAGVNTVAIGFESPVAQDLESMKKHIKQEKMVGLARKYRNAGFLIHGMFIFGYPGEKNNSDHSLTLHERVRQYKKFIQKAGIDTIQILLPVPLPGTLLRKRLLEQKRVYNAEEIGWEFYDGNFLLFEPDAPYTAEQMQLSTRKITGSFYRFRHFFMIAVHVLSFPTIALFFSDIKTGWRKWYRNWRNSLVRFGGWILFRNWTTQFRKNAFLTKLQNARIAIQSK